MQNHDCFLSERIPEPGHLLQVSNNRGDLPAACLRVLQSTERGNCQNLWSEYLLVKH